MITVQIKSGSLCFVNSNVHESNIGNTHDFSILLEESCKHKNSNALHITGKVLHMFAQIDGKY